MSNSRFYTLRDFYKEQGKSLRMSYSRWWGEVARYRESKVVSSAVWSLSKKLHRVNGWHKMDVLHKRLKKGYSITNIDMARLNLHSY